MFEELINIRNAGIAFDIEAPADADHNFNVALMNSAGEKIAITSQIKAEEVVPFLQQHIRINFPDCDYSKLNPAQPEETPNSNDGQLSNEGAEEASA